MRTVVKNLADGTEQIYTCSPSAAVIAAYAQSKGDYNTWEYAERYGALLVEGEHTFGCGDFATLKHKGRYTVFVKQLVANGVKPIDTARSIIEGFRTLAEANEYCALMYQTGCVTFTALGHIVRADDLSLAILIARKHGFIPE